MTALPDPPTPAECDLSDFPFMPLEIARLKRSKAWRNARTKPELAFYMINLWTAAWHNVPAGSLEDDDDALADLALCSRRRWPSLRSAVLHGWYKCSDGRLYHGFLEGKVRDIWKSKRDQRARTEAARKAKLDKNPAKSKGSGSVTKSVTKPVTDSVTASKGEGEGESKGDSTPLPPDRPKPPASPVAVIREMVFDRYCKAAGIDPTQLRRVSAFVALPSVYTDWVAKGCDPDLDIWPTITAVLAKASQPPNSPAYFTSAILRARDERRRSGPTDEERWTYRVFSYRQSGNWSESWGPKPDEPGCLAPAEALKEAS